MLTGWNWWLTGAEIGRNRYRDFGFDFSSDFGSDFHLDFGMDFGSGGGEGRGRKNLYKLLYIKMKRLTNIYRTFESVECSILWIGITLFFW